MSRKLRRDPSWAADRDESYEPGAYVAVSVNIWRDPGLDEVALEERDGPWFYVRLLAYAGGLADSNGWVRVSDALRMLVPDSSAGRGLELIAALVKHGQIIEGTDDDGRPRVRAVRWQKYQKTPLEIKQGKTGSARRSSDYRKREKEKKEAAEAAASRVTGRDGDNVTSRGRHAPTTHNRTANNNTALAPMADEDGSRSVVGSNRARDEKPIGTTKSDPADFVWLQQILTLSGFRRIRVDAAMNVAALSVVDAGHDLRDVLSPLGRSARYPVILRTLQLAVGAA